MSGVLVRVKEFIVIFAAALCLLQNIEGEWEESLNHWTSCSVTCGPGARARVGQCNTNTTNCSGHKIELQPCNLGNCTATRTSWCSCFQDYWTAFQGSCYRVFTTNLNFTDAEGECKELGGHLVHIETSAENTFIINTFIKDLVRRDIGIQWYWIGLDDRETEGEWKWTDTDTIANFTDWSFGQPNEGTRANCAAISDYIQQWYDLSCSEKRPTLCEKVIETKHIVG